MLRMPLSKTCEAWLLATALRMRSLPSETPERTGREALVSYLHASHERVTTCYFEQSNHSLSIAASASKAGMARLVLEGGLVHLDIHAGLDSKAPPSQAHRRSCLNRPGFYSESQFPWLLSAGPAKHHSFSDCTLPACTDHCLSAV